MKAKNLILLYFVGCAIMSGAKFIFSSCQPVKDNTPQYSITDIVKAKEETKDSVEKVLSAKYIHTIDSLQTVVNDCQLDIDKYEAYNDSIADELLVANYKLERIRYYNSIAGNGNNIKFLRGWINRVLE